MSAWVPGLPVSVLFNGGLYAAVVVISEAELKEAGPKHVAMVNRDWNEACVHRRRRARRR
jgi:hypothetical protein